MIKKSPLSPIEQHIVDFVMKLRLKNHLTQADIGYILDVDSSFISKIEDPRERSKYNINHINKIAAHFGISPKDFLPIHSCF